MGIRWLVLGLVALLVVLGQGLSYGLFRDAIEREVRQHEFEKVKQIGSIIQILVDEYAEEVQLAAHLLAVNDGLASRFGKSSEADFSRFISARIDSILKKGVIDSLQMTDDREIVRYRAHDPARKGDRATAWGVFEALQGNASRVAHVTPEGASILAVEPLREGQRIIGTVIAGRMLDGAFLAHLARDTGAYLALVSRERPIAYSRSEIRGTTEQSAIRLAFEQKIPIFRSEPGVRATTAYVPMLIVDDGFVMMVRIDSGELAVQALRQGEFDIVLMDCQMPVLDEYRAASMIRAEEPAGGRIPIIALTANAFAEDRDRCIAAGMDDFLAKPVSVAKLAQVLGRWTVERQSPSGQDVPSGPGAAARADQDAGDDSTGVQTPSTHAAPGTGSAAVPASFDPAALDHLVQMDRDTPGFLARVAERFLDGTPALIASVAGASEESAKDAERAAHSLNSTSARFGAHALAQLAAQAETAARGGDLAAARELGHTMTNEFQKVATALRSACASKGR